MAFLLATVAAYGEDGWQDYWSRLMDNGAELTAGWSDAYEVDFTQGGSGDRPIVLSYDSSPAFTVPKGAKTSTTSALLDTCFEQVEYVGVLAGAANVDGARAFVRFMDSPEVQAALPESMYVFPDADGVELPAEWAKYAVQPTDRTPWIPPTSPRTATSGCGTGATSRRDEVPEVTTLRRTLTLAALAWCRCWCSACSSCSP